MPELTRRRYRERQDCWHVYYGDVHVGTIARRVGIPHNGQPWRWICGFYPGSEPGEFRDGTAATFDQAWADFEVAWKRFFGEADRGRLSGLAGPAGLDDAEICQVGGWRTATIAKTQFTDEVRLWRTFDSHQFEHNLIHVPHITAAQAALGPGFHAWENGHKSLGNKRG